MGAVVAPSDGHILMSPRGVTRVIERLAMALTADSQDLRVQTKRVPVVWVSKYELKVSITEF